MDEAAFGCVGSSIILSNGNYFDLLKPDPRLITIDVVAAGLSKICRFGGQIPRFYSVAEHSIGCAEAAETAGLSRETRLACLLHDATEAFIGDVVKPLKVIIGPLYGPIEEEIERAVSIAFGVDLESTKEEWKAIDRAMLIAERKAMFPRHAQKWHGEDEVDELAYSPRYWYPEIASFNFSGCYQSIVEDD